MSYIKENLNNLEAYVSTVNSNIDTFNIHTKVNVEGLKERGERTDNLMTNLFNFYCVQSGSESVKYSKTNKYR